MILFKKTKMYFHNFSHRFIIIDISILEEISSIGGEEARSRLIDLFIESSNDLIFMIRNNFDNNDYDNLFKHSHELKGASLSIGAYELAYWCNRMCRDIESEKYSSLKRYLMKIEKAFLKVSKRLKLL